MIRSFVVLSLAFVVAAASPRAVMTQVVEGRVLGSAEGEPVDGATVQLLLSNRDRVLRTAVTGEDGSFSIEAPASAAYVLRASRIGYETVTTAPFDLVMNTAPFVVEVLLGIDAVPLAPLVVVSERPLRLGEQRLRTVGYYEREEGWGREGLGFGHFLGPEDLAEMHAFRTSEILEGVPGVRIEGAGARQNIVTMRPQASFTERRCVPVVFVNGGAAATGATIDDVVTPRDISAIEVYPGTSMPARFIRANNRCGVIAIWTGPR